jgi:hypothetical protein
VAKVIEITVTQDGETLTSCKFDDRNLTYVAGRITIDMEGAMIESRAAPIWQRVAHASTIIAWSGIDR